MHESLRRHMGCLMFGRFLGVSLIRNGECALLLLTRTWEAERNSSFWQPRHRRRARARWLAWPPTLDINGGWAMVTFCPQPESLHRSTVPTTHLLVRDETGSVNFTCLRIYTLHHATTCPDQLLSHKRAWQWFHGFVQRGPFVFNVDVCGTYHAE